MLVKISSGSTRETCQINEEWSFIELKRFVCAKVQLAIYEVEILSGFPPKLLEAPNEMRITDLGIQNGVVLTVRPSATKRSYLEKLLELGFPETTVKSVLETDSSKSFEEILDICSRVQDDSIDLIRLSVPADNSCLFNSIKKLLNLEEDAFQLRQIVAKVIESDPDTYNQEFLDKSPSDYIKWILQPSHWGGEIEVSILSNFYEVEIVVCDIRSAISLHYSEGKGFKDMILLLYDGIHYDGIAQKLSSSSKMVTRFKSGREDVKEAALTFTKKLQQERKYVDLASGTMYCYDCNQSLKGEKEAVEHAKLTGHVNFGQK